VSVANGPDWLFREVDYSSQMVEAAGHQRVSQRLHNESGHFFRQTEQNVVPVLLYNWVGSVYNVTMLFMSVYVYHHFIDRHRTWPFEGDQLSH
jgi:hypothetical protein